MSMNPLSSTVCGVCAKPLDDPRILQCLHSFCIKCLKGICDEQQSRLRIKCPTCETSITLPEGGVDAIQKDIRKSHVVDIAAITNKIQSEEKNCDFCVKSSGPACHFCHDCHDFLCETCSDYHKTCRKFLSHKLVPADSSKCDTLPTSSEHKPSKCQLHESEDLKFYCKTCSCLICCDCMATAHVGHLHLRIEKVVHEEMAELQTLLDSNDIEGIKASLNEKIAKGCTLTQPAGENSQVPIEEFIERTFAGIEDALLRRKEALFGKLEGVKSALVVQRREFEALRDDFVETCKMISEAAQKYTPIEMLSIKGVMTRKLEELQKQYEELCLEPCKNDFVSVKVSTSELVEDILSFGSLIQGSCPQNAETDFYTKTVVVGKKRKITITAHDACGKRYQCGGECVKVTLSQPNDTGEDIEGSVVDNKDGTYVAYISQDDMKKCGVNRLSITFNSNHIKDSPFETRVKTAIDYSAIVQAQVWFQCSHSLCPVDVAVSNDGDIYVTNARYGFINVFDRDGKYLRSIGADEHTIKSNGYGVFCYPSAIAIDGDVLYVAEERKGCVQKLTTSGELLTKFGVPGSGDGQLNGPRSLCLHKDGRVFVSGCSNNRISVFNSDGAFLYHITGSVSESSNLSRPWGLAFDFYGNLHVADTYNNRIVVFTSQGKYITQYNSVVKQPAGIAFDTDGNIVIAEYEVVNQNSGYYYQSSSINYSRVCFLDSRHYPLETLNVGQCAQGITVDANNSLYVCSSNGVQTFRSLQDVRRCDEVYDS